ncbi:O-antigen ligase domain-containing protein [Bacillus thuringiensis]|nr:O-antigen ligase domain-containing protein [Bacillus thuringiensis]
MKINTKYDSKGELYLYVLIIIALLFSALSGIAERVDSNSVLISSLTLMAVIAIVFVYLLKLIKNKEIKKHTGIYTLIFINVLLIFISAFATTINGQAIKFVVYYTFMAIIVNIVDEDILLKSCKVLVYTSIILSLDIIVQGMELYNTGIDLVNLRSFTLMDKQYYTAFYAIVLPISFWLYFATKKIRHLLILAISVVSCIVLMQIKTLLITVPLAIYIVLFITRGYSRKKLALYGGILILIFLYMIITGNEALNQFYVILYYIFGMSNKIPLEYMKYVDTLIVRLEIIRNAMEHLSNNYLLGIGVGNYPEIVQGKSVMSIARNISYDLPNEAESGVLLFLVEGGILGLIAHISIYIYIVKGYMKRHNKESLVQNIIISIVLTNGISNIFQDNLNFLYWFFLGSGVYVTSALFSKNKIENNKKEKTTKNLNVTGVTNHENINL